MTGKNVWRWIVSKFGNDVIYKIYEDKKVVCDGFRANTVRDISSNRNQFVSNLLNKQNFKKLVLWTAENPPVSLEGISLVDKEINELVNIATEKGVADVLIKLLCENQEKLAIQLFAFLHDEQNELLDIPNQSIGLFKTEASDSIKKETEVKEITEVKETTEQTQKVETIKSEDKKIKKLEKKVENLNEELKKRDALHKAKIAELERNHQQTLQKLNEKNQLYGNLVKEKNSLTKKYEEEKSKWETELNLCRKSIKCLEIKNDKLQEQLDSVTNHTAIQGSQRSKRKLRFLVIGKPANTTHFQNEAIEFTFIEGNDVHDYEFSEDFDAYLVLFYDLAPKEQLLLKYNDSYSRLDCKKVFNCKNFDEVRKRIDHFSRLEERVI